MRIVSGSLGGRTIKAPKTNATRPITDKMRAALFDSIGDVGGMTVVDAYAGTGAVGFEALSRGAARVIAIEASSKAAASILANQRELDLGWGYSFYNSTVEAWLSRQGSDFTGAADLVVADPPYEKLATDVIEKLGHLLKTGGVLALSYASRIEPPDLDNLKLISSKKYGDSALSLYQSG